MSIKRKFVTFRAVGIGRRDPAPAAQPVAASDQAPRRTAMEWISLWASRLKDRYTNAADPDALQRALRAKHNDVPPQPGRTTPLAPWEERELRSKHIDVSRPTQERPLAPNDTPQLADVPPPDLKAALRAAGKGAK